MTVKELYRYLDKRIPSALSCEWDNDGLMCCPKGEREVKKVLVALDITNDMLKLAMKNGCDVIISHHPLVFKPIKSLTSDGGVPSKLIKLVQNGMSAMSFHTRLDVLPGGVNDALCEKLGLKNIEPFGEDGIMMGRIGETDECGLEDFASFVKVALGSPMVLYSGELPVKKVAVLGGNGDDFISAARRAGADTYVSGRLGYHAMEDAKENGINLVEAGHHFTEAPVLEYLGAMVKDADKNIEVIYGDSNNIGSV